MVNTSLLQTMTRSVNTLATVLITLFALYFFGGDTLKNFAFALLVGVTSGAYSSIFIASPLLVLWKNADVRNRVAVRAAASSRELQTSAAGSTAGGGGSTSQITRTPPKRKLAPQPPPRYRKKRQHSTSQPETSSTTPSETTSSPGGIIGLMAELRDDHGGEHTDEHLPGNS
jgi:hypothetical protein